MRTVFLSLLLVISYRCFAQVHYGNEWIVFGQKYLKIRTSENGLYKISYSQLRNAGFLTSDLNPKNLKLYYQGNEIPLFIEGEGDNSFDQDDYILFLGKRNDGALDRVLYGNVNQQPNPEISLFSDESSYFLTYSPGSAGKRYESEEPIQSNTENQSFIIYTSSANFTEQYYPGAYLLDVMSLSEYIDAEGYMGPTFEKGGITTKLLATPGKIATNEFNPFIEFYVAGRSNSQSTSAHNHHLRVSTSNSTLKDTVYSGYAAVRSKVFLKSEDISNTTSVAFQSIDDLGASTDYQAPAYVRITYPRDLNISGIQFIEFRTKPATNDAVIKLSFTNGNWTRPVMLDTLKAIIYRGYMAGPDINFNIIHPGLTTLHAGDENAAKTPLVELVSFTQINTASFSSNLLIITHKSLYEAAEAFSAYKTSKGFSPFLITVDELYDQFYYGNHHPMAIRNFVRFLLNQADNKPEYLLLLGKGYEIPKYVLSQNLVPTMGYPASDAAFSSQINDNNLAPALATGRIPAKTNQEILDYLNKLKDYDNLPDSLYRKNFIHVTGGKDIYENSTFSSYMKSFEEIAKTQGIKTISYNKKVTDAVTENLTERIITSANKGASVLSFFGHGSLGATEVSLGSPNNYALNKLLIYVINGCSTANAFTSTASMGENFLFSKDRGAIAWIGTTSEGVASYLNSYTTLLYRYSFINNYGASIAKNMLKACRDFQVPTDFNLNRAHTRQYMYLGDPTLSLYSPAKPDFETASSDIFLATPNITATSEKIKLGVIIRNPGKATGTSMQVAITRSLADGSIINYPALAFPSPAHTDTVYYELDNTGINSAGNNTFTVKIDPSNIISELNELNNTASANFIIPANGVTIISPADFSIYSAPSITLKVQQTDLLKKNSEYVFEIDTVNTFNSPWKKSSPVITADIFATWQPPAIMEANRVYYWRARLNLPDSEGALWKPSSFTFIPDSPDGWNQGHYQQLANVSFDKMQFSSDKKSFEYAKTTYPILLRTRGDLAPPSAMERAIRVSISVGKLSFNTEEFEGFSIVALHPTKQTVPFNYPSPYNYKNDGINATGQFYFNPNDPVQADSLIKYINNIPQGYFVIGMSGRNLSPKDLPTAVKEALGSLGLSRYNIVGLGEPYAFSGIKGSASGTADEFLADYTSGTPPREQIINSNFTLPYPFSSGSLISEKIGPSSNWRSVAVKFDSEPSDAVSYDVIGVSSTGNETTLISNIRNENSQEEQDLSSIQAEEYPYLRLKVNVTDNVNSTPAQLNYLKVLYDTYPEVTINPEIANISNLSSIARGDSIRLKLGVSNLDKYPSDSIDVAFEITKQDRTKIPGKINTLAPIPGNSSTSFEFSYPTNALVDSTVLQVYIHPKDNRDRITLNNRIGYNFRVIPDTKEPLVDVLFDGRRIINGELVSPKPQISISVSDDNRFMLLNDTTAVEVYLKDPSEKESRIAFSSNKITMQSSGTSESNKVSYLFNPDALEDGIYTLRVRSKDKSGNRSATNDLNIDFEVINEASISNFLPYPNPFTTSMRFVFRITGQKIPDKIKVQILTVTGKIVREVLKEELGDLKIGNNISSFSWDGTDQFGDRLANGVYFYRVLVENNDKSEIKHRATSADTMFKRNYGKIYLMR